ncbi:hypothetical protein, partial [Pseudomonas sp. PNPG3]|uniref:hypothetical protein n=1 Tax=Pseudomonas sp. PNPG3 TaxID=2919497 RepID=UPI001FFD9A4D
MASSSSSASGLGSVPGIVSGIASGVGASVVHGSRSQILIGSRPLPLGLIARAGLMAQAVGALSLVEPRTLGPRRRAWYRVGMAAASGALSADLARDGQRLVSPA